MIKHNKKLDIGINRLSKKSMTSAEKKKFRYLCRYRMKYVFGTLHWKKKSSYPLSRFRDDCYTTEYLRKEGLI